MKSNTAASLAALCALAYGTSSVLAAPVDNASVPPPGPISDIPATNMSQEDAAIYGGIRHGVKQGLNQALAENLGLSVDHDLVRDEEVDQVLECIGDKVITKMVGCIKTEHLAVQAQVGAKGDESQHTDSIQKCISPSTLEHVEYCVSKLEISRLAEDVHIWQQLYDESQLKEKEYMYEHPNYATDNWPGNKEVSQMDKATDPLFSPSWYEMHKDSANDFNADKLPDNHDADLMAKVAAPIDVKPDPAAAGPTPPADPSKPTNSTAPGTDDANKAANNSTTTPEAKPSTSSPLPADASKDDNKDASKDDNKDASKDDNKDTSKDASIPLVKRKFFKRKFGYGPDYLTAVGVRDLHPLNRRAIIGAWDSAAGLGEATHYDDDRAYRIQSSLVDV
jgi:hypothetical protein